MDVSGSWVLGHARLDTTTSNIQRGVLFPYTRAVALYHCPGDHSTIPGRKQLLRTRSYSLSWYLGSVDDLSASRRIKLKLAQLPNPAQIYAFIDEDDRTVNDGTYWLPVELGPTWGDIPADRHGRGANISFTDGHVEHWRWKWRKHGISQFDMPSNQYDLEDLLRIQEASPTP